MDVNELRTAHMDLTCETCGHTPFTIDWPSLICGLMCGASIGLTVAFLSGVI